MVARPQKPAWLVTLVMAWAAFVAQVVPQAWGGDCDRGCCAAQSPDCCAVAVGSPRSTSRVAPAEAETGCPLCAATSGRGLTPIDESPCHCQLDAKQDQSFAGHGATQLQRDDLPVWGEVADSTQAGSSHGLDASRTYAVASLSIPIRPVRILYGVWRN